MNIPASRQIAEKINSLAAGTLFSRKDFESLEISNQRIDTELSRLYRSKKISRKRKGLYYIAKSTPLGPATISPEQIVRKIYETNRLKDKKIFGTENKNINRVVPTGLTLLNALGLSTQVPARKEYWSTFRLETPTLIVKKAPMEIWSSLSDNELMLFLAIAFLNQLPGDNIDDIKDKILKLMAIQKTQVRKLTDAAKRTRGNLGKNVIKFFQEEDQSGSQTNAHRF
jgi:hypothetical protein